MPALNETIREAFQRELEIPKTHETIFGQGFKTGQSAKFADVFAVFIKIKNLEHRVDDKVHRDKIADLKKGTSELPEEQLAEFFDSTASMHKFLHTVSLMSMMFDEMKDGREQLSHTDKLKLTSYIRIVIDYLDKEYEHATAMQKSLMPNTSREFALPTGGDNFSFLDLISKAKGLKDPELPAKTTELPEEAQKYKGSSKLIGQMISHLEDLALDLGIDINDRGRGK